MLKTLGRKMRGGADEPGALVEEKTEEAMGGRRRRGTRKTRRGRRSLFGMKY